MNRDQAPLEHQSVKLLTDPDHGFDDRGLHYQVQHAGSYGREVLVDAAPAYAHDVDLVARELARVQVLAPLPFPLAVLLLSHECVSRTNGTYYDEYNYSGEPTTIGGKTKYPPVGYIVLSAKRIPIHPALTRYLVSHEYGHGVMYHLARLRGVDSQSLLADYRDLCRPNTSHGYGCGRWHANVGELFANDFRILVAEREVEFWPHPGFLRPDELLAVVGWWAQAIKELRQVVTVAA